MRKLTVMMTALGIAAFLAACGGNTGSSTANSETAARQAKTMQQAQQSEKTYTVTIRDQYGEGVSGCVVNFCDASSCSPVMQDTDGVYSFSGEAYAYHIQIVKVPEGYRYDTSGEYTADENGGGIEVTITKE